MKHTLRCHGFGDTGKGADLVSRITPLEKLTVPLGGQAIELQEIDFEWDTKPR